MPVTNVVDQADDLGVDRQHKFWNHIRASGIRHPSNPNEEKRRSWISDRQIICTIFIASAILALSRRPLILCARLYYESFATDFSTQRLDLPVAVSIFAGSGRRQAGADRRCGVRARLLAG